MTSDLTKVLYMFLTQCYTTIKISEIYIFETSHNKKISDKKTINIAKLYTKRKIQFQKSTKEINLVEATMRINTK